MIYLAINQDIINQSKLMGLLFGKLKRRQLFPANSYFVG